MTACSYEVLGEFDDTEVQFGLPKFYFGQNPADEAKIMIDVFKVPAGSANLALTIGTYPNAKMFHFEDLDQSADLSIKVNGDTVAWPINNAAVFSEVITALTATNADVTNDASLMLYVVCSDET